MNGDTHSMKAAVQTTPPSSSTVKPVGGSSPYLSVSLQCASSE